MHEFGLAMRIVEMVAEHAKAHHPRRVNQIELELGELAGVMHESLTFSLKTIVADSAFPGAEIVVNRIPGAGECTGCGHRYPLTALFSACPKCAHPNPRIVGGKEFRIKSIQVV